MNRRLVVAAIAAAVLAAALPVAASLYLSWTAALRSEQARLHQHAHEAIARTERVYRTARAGIQKLQRPAGELCSATHIAEMQGLTFASPYLQEFGVIEDGRVMCTSWGKLARPAPVGRPDFVSPDGYEVWFAWEAKAAAPGKRAIALAQGPITVLIDPAHLVDVVVDNPAHGLVVFTANSRKVLAATASSPDGLAAQYDRSEAVLGGERFVTYVASSLVPVVAAASAPRTELVSVWRAQALRLLPWGAVAAAAMVGLVIWLADRRLSLKGELEAAIRRHEFVVHYQPIVALATGRCVAAEALVRWPRPDGTMMRPDLFIPLAEDTGLIVPITAQVVETLARDLGALLRQNPELRINVNLSVSDIAAPSTRALLAAAMRTGGMSASQLTLEITERGAIDPGVTGSAVAELRRAGHRVYIDDFGTGYSNLSYLESLAVDGIKIDKAFVDAVGAEAATSGVIGHIIDMAQTLHLAIVAEGVETREQAEFLSGRGVPLAQGWLYGKAMPLADFERFFAEAGRPAVTPAARA